MKVLGVDPGLKATGYAVLEYQNRKTRVLEAGAINLKPSRPIPERVEKIYRDLNELVTQYQPRVLVLEKLYSHSKYVTTASILGHARGVICLVASQNQLEFAEYSVKRIRKAVVGNGSASKVQTRKILGQLLNIDESKLTLDASDALALALGHVQIQGRNL